MRGETSGAFSVQVGAFSQKENSDAVVRDLESRGYQPYVVVMPGRRARLHTVRIGRFAGRREAQQAAAELRQRANMSGIVIW
jgi:cell division septation protein DedD